MLVHSMAMRMEAHNMLQKYKEIFYGGLFGFGTAVLDTFNGCSDVSFRDELVKLGPRFVLSRSIHLARSSSWLAALAENTRDFHASDEVSVRLEIFDLGYFLADGVACSAIEAAKT
jgi:hypothetical protein